MNWKSIFNLFKDSYKDWSEDNASTWAAAMAYFMMFSIGPVLLLLVSIVGLVYGQKAAQGQIVGQIQSFVGSSTAQVIQMLIQNAGHQRAGIIGTAIGVVSVLLGATGFFSQLQNALNTIWEVKAPGGIKNMLWKRLIGFLIVLGTGVLVIVLIVVSAGITAVAAYFKGVLPGALNGFILQAIDFVISFGIMMLLFAVIFRVLPDTKVAWKDVWVGAAFTALLFAIGKLALGVYFGLASVGSAFGAAGSLVALLVWIYYSAQIFLFGAEFTQVYANQYGPNRVPVQNPMTPEAQHEIVQEGGPPQARGKSKREREQAVGRGQPEGSGEPRHREERVTAWQGGPSYRPSPIRAAIVQFSVVAGLVGAAIDLLRGRREAL